MLKQLTIAPMLLTACALAQSPQNSPAIEPRNLTIQMSDGPGFGGGMSITTAMAAPMSAVTGAPYSAQTMTQRIQTLADGNQIEQDSSGSVARDTQGRVRREEELPVPGPKGGEPQTIVMIDDPVSQVHWTLDAQRKIAIKLPFPSLKSLPLKAPLNSEMMADRPIIVAETGSPGVARAMISTGAFSIADGGPGDANEVKTDLGTQTIEGVAAHGTRLTRTIPAGQIGNAEPIVITTETWYSPDLKVLVMSKSTDPRIGDTVYKLTDIQRSEPSPSRFQPPDDYTVKDQAQMMLNKSQ